MTMRRREGLQERSTPGPCSQAWHLSGHVQVNDEVLGWQGPEEHVQVPSRQPQGLGTGFGELDVISSRHRTPDAIHSALQSPILKRETGEAARSSERHQEGHRRVTLAGFYQGSQERRKRSPGPLTVTAATSPSLVDRFHSPTLKCLKTLRNGCCHTGGPRRCEDPRGHEGASPDARPRPARAGIPLWASRPSREEPKAGSVFRNRYY